MIKIKNLSSNNFKKFKMRYFRTIFLAALIGLLVVNSAKAQEIIAQGKCGANGDNLTWVLTSDSVLTINGNGDMQNSGYEGPPPWIDYHSFINTVIINNGVTSIGSAAFSFCSELISITIPISVISIGNWAFNYCSNLTLIINNNPTPIEVNIEIFYGMTPLSDCFLRVPINAITAYQNANVWKEFNVGGIGNSGITDDKIINIKIYPDPTSSQLIIEKVQPVNTNYEIYNLIGQLQKQGKLQGETTTINIESLANGMYYLKVAGQVAKFIKE